MEATVSSTAARQPLVTDIPSIALSPYDRTTLIPRSHPASQASDPASATSLVFIDSSVNDYQSLLAGVQPGTEVHLLNTAQDAIDQITQTLLGRTHIASLHIVSHGQAGSLALGNHWLSLANLRSYSGELQSWGNALTDDADILLYGCDVAQGAIGHAFVQQLAQLTGADIAASDNLTGSAALGGDWTLEVNTGAIATSNSFERKIVDHWQGTLGTFSGQQSSDTYTVAVGKTLRAENAVATLQMTSEPRNYVGQGLSYFITQRTGNFVPSSNGKNYISVGYNGYQPGSFWYLNFAAPTNALLTAGTTYNGATRYPFQSANNPGLDVSGDGRGNNELIGSFTVNQVEYGTYPSDNNVPVNKVDITFEQKGQGDTGWLRGRIQYQSSNLPAGVLANDRQSSGSTGTLSASLASGTANGSLSFNSDGSFTYTPNAGFSGVDQFTYRITDSQGTSDPATVTLNVLNTAPTLDTSGAPSLLPVKGSDTNNLGTTISALLGTLGGTKIVDPDPGAVRGIAVTAVNSANGSWQFSTDGGNTWRALGNPTDSTARLLADNSNDRIRFVPNTNFNGTTVNGIAFRAWDQTSGSNGAIADTTANGGSTAFSTATETASITVANAQLLWRNSATGENAVWQLNNFTLQTSYYLPTVSEPDWQIASSTADFNHDGIADLLWRNQITGANAIWQMNSTGYQTGYFLTSVADTNWQIVSLADFNRDKTPDLLWRNSRTGENAIWQMNGFTVQTTAFITSVADPDWQIASTADFNGDSTPDILWRNVKTGENAIWQMQGFTVQTTAFITSVADRNWQVAGTADFNGDGKADIVWRNQASGENAIWRMNGMTLQSGYFINSLADANWQMAGVVDLGGDNTPDILWRNQQAGKAMIWQLSGFSYAQTYQLPDVLDRNWSVKPFVVA